MIRYLYIGTLLAILAATRRFQRKLVSSICVASSRNAAAVCRTGSELAVIAIRSRNVELMQDRKNESLKCCASTQKLAQHISEQ